MSSLRNFAVKIQEMSIASTDDIVYKYDVKDMLPVETLLTQNRDSNNVSKNTSKYSPPTK